MLRRQEITTILINVTVTKLVLTFPKILIETSGSAAWIQIIYNIICAAAVFFLSLLLYKGHYTVIDLAEKAGGKILKIITGLIVFAVFMVNFASIIRVFPETVKTVLLINFDTRVITIIFMAAIALGSAAGIEAIARVNYIFMPIIGGVLIFFLILLIPYYNIYNIFPIFGNGVNKIFIDGFNTISVYADVLLINIFMPYYENRKEVAKSGRHLFAITAPFITAVTLAYCLAYPYPVTKEFMLPFYQMARIIHIGNFYSRFESVFQFAWSILIFIYSAIYIFALCHVVQKTFDLKFYRPLIFPVVMISGVFALLPATIGDIVRNEKWENIFIYITVFTLLLVFGIISRVVLRKDKKNEAY